MKCTDLKGTICWLQTNVYCFPNPIQDIEQHHNHGSSSCPFSLSSCPQLMDMSIYLYKLNSANKKISLLCPSHSQPPKQPHSTLLTISAGTLFIFLSKMLFLCFSELILDKYCLTFPSDVFTVLLLQLDCLGLNPSPSPSWPYDPRQVT